MTRKLKCSLCEYESSDKSNLRKHIRKKHNTQEYNLPELRVRSQQQKEESKQRKLRAGRIYQLKKKSPRDEVVYVEVEDPNSPREDSTIIMDPWDMLDFPSDDLRTAFQLLSSSQEFLPHPPFSRQELFTYLWVQTKKMWTVGLHTDRLGNVFQELFGEVFHPARNEHVRDLIDHIPRSIITPRAEEFRSFIEFMTDNQETLVLEPMETRLPYITRCTFSA